MSAGTIAWLTFHEARRRKMLWAVALMGLAFLALFALAFWLVHRELNAPGERSLVGERPEIYNMLTLMGLYAVNFLVVMLAVLASVDTLSGEIASGTIHTVVTRPIARRDVVLGKWLGLAAMLGLFTVLMSLGLMQISRAISGHAMPNPAQGIAVMVVEGWVMLSLSLALGTRLSTLTNGVVLFMLYGVAFLGGWIEQIGALLPNEAAVTIGIAVSLVMPTEAMWRLAATVMQPPLLRGLAIGPMVTASAPNLLMVFYTLAYIGLVLILAVRSFARRDL
jgi:ABC-type transport system involved in multi-copper enzyme maturation permease subunit